MKPALALVLRWPLPWRWMGLGALLGATVLGWCCVRFYRLWRVATPPGQIVIPILLVMLFLTLAGCASLSDFRPYAGLVMKDDATRAADPGWYGIGQLWIGFKSHF